MWHCASDADQKVFDEVEPNYVAIGGGCTVGLRSISLAIMFGHNNIHLFGFDSALGNSGEHHAYPETDEREKHGLLGEGGKIHQVQLGLNGPSGTVYQCMGYQLAQMWHFKDMLMQNGHMFTPTIHGGGLLQAVVDIIKQLKSANNA